MRALFFLPITLIVVVAMGQTPASRSQAGAATKADVDRWMKEVSNWGRWGKDDQLGAINLITPAKRKTAAAEVKEGVSVSMAHEPLTEKAPDNGDPFVFEMLATGDAPVLGQFSVDRYSVLYHGLAHTHMDSLSHIFVGGRMYNGHPASSITKKGADKLEVANFRNGIFTRGVLMDIPRLKGVPYLEPGTAIWPEDLDAWEKKAGMKVQSGDVVFIRTGRWALRAAKGAGAYADKQAGLHASCVKWLKSRDIAMLGSDAGSDVNPSGIEGNTHPVHQLILIGMGAPIFDNCDLEAVGEAAAQRNRWTFLVTAAPIPVKGGTGSPLNPIATF
jgi:kynurenine formamidase